MKSVRIRCFSGSYSGPFLIQILIQKCLFRTLLRNTDLKNLFIWIRHFLHRAIFYIVILLYIYLLIMLALLSHCIRAQFPQSFRRNTQNGVGTVCFHKIPTPGNYIQFRDFTQTRWIYQNNAKANINS